MKARPDRRRHAAAHRLDRGPRPDGLHRRRRAWVVPGRWVQFAAPAKEGKSSLTVWMATELFEGVTPGTGTSITLESSPSPPRCRCVPTWIADPGLHVADPVKLSNLYATECCAPRHGEGWCPRPLGLADRSPSGTWSSSTGLSASAFSIRRVSESDDRTWRRVRRPCCGSTSSIGAHRRSGKPPTTWARTPGRTRGRRSRPTRPTGWCRCAAPDRGSSSHTLHGRGGAYLTTDLALDTEGFDPSRPIRHRRVRVASPLGQRRLPDSARPAWCAAR